MFTQTHYFFYSFSPTIKILSETQKYPKHIRKPGQEHSNRRKRLRGGGKVVSGGKFIVTTKSYNEKRKRIRLRWLRMLRLRGRQLIIRAVCNREGLGTRLGGGGCGGRGKQPGEAEQTLLSMDRKTKEMIKGILASFALIDHHWRWVKGLLESGGVFRRQKTTERATAR